MGHCPKMVKISPGFFMVLNSNDRFFFSYTNLYLATYCIIFFGDVIEVDVYPDPDLGLLHLHEY